MSSPEFRPPTGDNLLDPESREKLPPLYSGEEQGLDAIAQVKFFSPDAQWTWFAVSASQDPDTGDVQFFGLVHGFERELGYFWLSELESVRGPLGLPVERDLYWTPVPLADLM